MSNVIASLTRDPQRAGLAPERKVCKHRRAYPPGCIGGSRRKSTAGALFPCSRNGRVGTWTPSATPERLRLRS